MKSFHSLSRYCSSKELVMTRNACKYDTSIFTHRCSLLNFNTIVHSLLTQKAVINEVFNVNQSYRYSLKNLLSHIDSVSLSSMHMNSSVANPCDDLHKSREDDRR